MTEVFWTAVLATLISPPILLSHSLFPVVLLNGRKMILLVYPPAFSIHLSNDRKYQIALSFSASGSYLYKCCERKETIAYSVRSSGGWHADNRFCCGVIAARWGVSLPNRGLLARRRHLTVPSMNKWDSSPWWMELFMDNRGQYWVTIVFFLLCGRLLFCVQSYPDDAGRGPGAGPRQINYTFSINVLMTNCCVFCR